MRRLHEPAAPAIRLAVALVFALGACTSESPAPATQASPEAAAPPSGAQLSGWEVVRTPPAPIAEAIKARWRAHRGQRERHPVVVYVELNGGVINAGPDSNALTRTSWLVPATMDYPAFAAPWATDELLQRLTAHFADFDVTFVTEPPTSGDYMMLVVGGSASTMGQSPGTLGLSPMDCAIEDGREVLDLNPVDIVFALSDDTTSYGLGAEGLTHVAAHEIGHALGLGHAARPGDVMGPYITGDDVSTWGAGPVPPGDRGCSLDGMQDDLKSLAQVAGWRVVVSSPAQLDVVADPYEVRVEVAPGLGVQGVQLNIWGSSVQVPAIVEPPFVFSVPAGSNIGLTHGLRIIRAFAWYPTARGVVDAYSLPVSVFVPQPPPSACTTNADCDTEHRCQVGFCLAVHVTSYACAADADCAGGRCVRAKLSYCTQACREDVGVYCPFGTNCGTDGYCVDQLAQPLATQGEACDDPLECEYGVCVHTDPEHIWGYCTTPCNPSTPACPDGTECVTPDEGVSWQCAECPASGCTVPASPSSGCSVAAAAATASATLPGILALIGLLAARRRRAGRP